MPVVRRPWSARCLLLAVVAAVVTPLLAVPTAALAEDGAGAPVRAGTTLVGELVQGYADPGPAHEGHPEPEDDGSGLLSWVQTAPGEAVRVPTEALAAADAGDTVEVTVGGTVQDEASAEGLEPARRVLAAEVVVAADEPAPAAATAAANHPVTVVMVQPGGVPRDTTTLAQVESAVRTGVASFWSDQSGGTVRFDVATGVDWITTTATCEKPFLLWEEVATAVRWAGRPGEHLLLYVPADTPGCAYGLGTVGRSPGEGGLAYVQAAQTSVIAHEFGHNLGLGHASAVQCDGSVDVAPCGVAAYRDYHDVMGVSWEQLGSLNAVHGARLGLLAAHPMYWYAGANTSFDLAPVSVPSGWRGIELISEDGTRYFVEYRPASGQDAWLATSANWPRVDAGVQVRKAAAGDSTSLLLDATPSRSSGWATDRAHSVAAGSAVSLNGGEFLVTVDRTSPTTASVRVSTRVSGGDIDRAHQASGGDAGPLGPAVTAQVCGLVKGGCVRTYRSGAIYWSPSSGARIVIGAVRTRWEATGAEAGWMGYPTADEQCGLPGGGCLQSFQVGTVYWSPSTGAQAVNGAIRQRWWSLRAESGWMGYPTGGEVCGLASGGCLQQFQVGTVYWSPSTGAQAVNGAVRERWRALGGESGPFGYPTAGEQCGLLGGGCLQHFQVGTVYWSPSTGAQLVNGALRQWWWSMRAENSSLGYPVSGEVCGLAAGGCRQRFQGGTAHWSPATGAHVVNGAIRYRWESVGAESGSFGYPTTGEVCGLRGGGCLQHFQGGSVYWSPATGAHPVNGAIFGAWGAYRWETGVLGYPVDAARPVRDGVVQQFQGGQLSWVAATGQVRRS